MPPSPSPSAEFIKVIGDFIRDVSTTFPEYERLLQKCSTDNDRLYEFCLRKYPARSADFFSKNESIFSEDSEVDTEFLPRVHFKNLWQYDDLSEGTKDAIWSYLQLISLSLGVEQLEPSISVPPEDMDEMVQNALEHMSQIWKKESDSGFFSGSDGTLPTATTSASSTDATADPPVPPLGGGADPFEGLFTGKLADIAKELAEETAGTLSFSEDATLEEATKQLFSNPGNLAAVMQSVTSKLDQRMKSGELNQEEMMAEAMAMMGKMGSIPGLGNLFNNIGNLGKNPKVQQMSRQEKIKARLRNKVNNKQQQLNKNMK
jgi:hypothetical protein